ncbi:MAG: hypothetical protein R1F52_06160 [Candidatus Nitrosoabyssus spongiisocia]|nr:MAG: hypothetical protein R1F52_06160 [Nitrosopumilaceae archaeon AB1(1)]
MITTEEIKRVANLMKIDIDDYDAHLEKIQKMISYFDTLDDANVSHVNLDLVDVDFDKLRDDIFISHNTDMRESIKTLENGFVRAPKMI